VSFNSDLKRFAKSTDVALDMAVRKIAFDAFGMITKKTPVDTGRARANWNVSVDSVDRSVDEEATKIQTPDINKGDGLKPIFIVNSLDYIQDLENGMPDGSRQAPDGMVAVTMNELRNSFN